MKTTIQTPNFKASEELVSFVNEHVAKLDLFTDRIIESTIYLRVDKSATNENKICEIKMQIPGKELFASKKSNTFEEAAVLAVEALKPQIERWKGSVSERQKANAKEN